MSKKTMTALLIVLVSLFVSTQLVLAQTRVTPEPDSPPVVDPPIWRDPGLRIGYQRVDATIEGQVATTHIEQLFINDNDWILEGTYLFPLPQGAAVSQLTMWVDGQPIEAKILPHDEAREIYDEIVRQVRDPALLEYVGRDAVQANVFPIPPHDERKVEITYTQILPADQGLIHFVYPQSTHLYSDGALEEQTVRVDVRAGETIHAIYSPSHRVAIDRQGSERAVVGYEAFDVAPEGDFELYYSVSAEEIGLNLLSYREEGQDGFFLLLVAPQVEATEVIAKDVILVLDSSGSMEGEKLQQAQQAAHYIVEHLNPEDRFSLISFSTGVRHFDRVLRPAQEPGSYAGFVDSLEAVGGTNISTALLEAASLVDLERPTTVIFLTDGLATEGIVEPGRLLEAVSEAMPANARIFAFGVGNDVDPDLLDNLTQEQRGTTTYVRPGEAIDEAVSSFYAKVSSPVLSDISLDYGDIVVEQLYPQILPDLFSGGQLIITGRYRDGGPATITLSGEVNGRTQSFTYAGQRFEQAGGEAFIPRMWATRAIGHLLRELRLHGQDDELVQSVVNLSIRYGIITPYTSFLIEEDDIFSQTAREAIVEQEMFMAPEALSPADAVEEAAVAADMADAEAPLPMPAATIPAGDAGSIAGSAPQAASVQIAGDKTFVWRDGQWIDTVYDESLHSLVEVAFAGDAYFDLLAANPQVGAYLSLGRQLLFVLDETAYQIVDRGPQTSSTQSSTQTDVVAVSESNSEAEIEVSEVEQAPVGVGVQSEGDPTGDESSPLAQTAPCGALVALPLLFTLGVIGIRRRTLL